MEHEGRQAVDLVCFCDFILKLESYPSRTGLAAIDSASLLISKLPFQPFISLEPPQLLGLFRPLRLLQDVLDRPFSDLLRL